MLSWSVGWPSEERLVRIALDGQTQIRYLSFDFGECELIVIHHHGLEPSLQKIEPLGMGIALLETRPVDDGETVLLNHPDYSSR